MTFDEIIKQASLELGVDSDLHQMADAYAKKTMPVQVPQDLFKGIPDDQAVQLMKGILVEALRRHTKGQ